jgi:hypothetical protein
VSIFLLQFCFIYDEHRIQTNLMSFFYLKAASKSVRLLMKGAAPRFFTGLLFLAAGANLNGQNYAIDWHKIAGGGGTSTGGVYSVGGTIGQHDASSTMSGGGYSLTGGFWSALAVVQTAGLPTLSIRHAAPDVVVVSWPNTAACTVQTSSDVSAANWTAYTGAVITGNGTNSVVITPPTGRLFFRLRSQ